MGYVKTLTWESEFFYRSIGEVEFTSDWNFLLAEELARFDLVQAKVSVDRLDHLDSLLGLGFRLAESEVSYIYEVDKCDHNSDYRVAILGDVSAVLAIAQEVFCRSRFRPPWFDEKDRARFYAVWAEKAIRGTFDNVCLLVEEKEYLVGFVTLREKSDGYAQIGLLAQNINKYKSKGGTRLVQAAISWCINRKIAKLRVTTQLSNITAIRLYERTGARLDSGAYWLYWSK